MRGVLKNGIYTKKEDENQKLRMGGGAWSINLEEIPKGTQIIEYITPKDRYLIGYDEAMEKGFIRMLGGEKKLIVPLKLWQVGEEVLALND
jgi:hypothetical protein